MSNETYKFRRAYAVLGLKPGTPLGQVRRRYKALVKRWHPDRYATDPVGQAEAESRMREINVAFRRLTETLSPGKDNSPTEPSVAAQKPIRNRLTRDEIENLVQSIGTQSPLDGVLTTIGWVGEAVYGIFFLLSVVGAFVRVAMLFSQGASGSILMDPALLLFLAIILLMVLDEHRQRRNLER